MNKAVFLDRDGIINREIGNYVWTIEEFEINPDIINILHQLKESGFYLIVVTNQAGIAKGLYTHEDVHKVHDYFQKESENLIDHFYYAANHPSKSESLARKPDSLLFEKGMAKYQLDPSHCWMIGDKERDLIPAKKFGMKTIRVFIDGFYDEGEETIGDYAIYELKEITKVIL